VITDRINDSLQQCKNYSNSVFQAEARLTDRWYLSSQEKETSSLFTRCTEMRVLIIPERYEDKTFYLPLIHVALLNEQEMLQII
jgi:hypothetical protein